MIDERREAQASMYVLGALPPEELREFEAVLESDRQLQLLVRELRGTAGAMVAAFPRVAPPPALKQKILAALENRATPAAPGSQGDTSAAPWLFWVPWAMAACFALLCVVLISVGHSLRNQAVQMQQRLGEQSEESATLREQLAQMESNAALVVTNYQTRIAEIQRQVLQRVDEINRQAAAITNQLKQQQAETKRQLAQAREQIENLRRDKKTLEDAIAVTVPDDRLSTTRVAVLRPTTVGPTGSLGATVWSGQDQRGVVVLENLPVLPPTQSYQFWLIDPKLAIPVSGGLVPPAASGSVRFQFAPQVRVDSAERFAISVEPAGGSATPTPGRIVMASN